MLTRNGVLLSSQHVRMQQQCVMDVMSAVRLQELHKVAWEIGIISPYVFLTERSPAAAPGHQTI